MTDLIADIKDFFNDRIRSPFIASFAFAWLVWNWFLVYSVCSFPETMPLLERIKFINDYIQLHQKTNLSWTPLKFSFGITLIYILCSSAFLFVFSFYKASIRPWILKRTSKSDMIERAYYNKLEHKFNLLKNDYEAERERVHNIEEEMASKEDKYNYLLSADAVNKEKDAESERRIKVLEKRISHLEHFTEGTRASFENKFQNQKTWFLYTKLKGDRIQIEELQFDKQSEVRNVETNQIKYIIQNILFSLDSHMLHFVLVDLHDKNIKYTFYLTERENNRYRGVKILGATKEDVVLTQPKPSKQGSWSIFNS